MASTTAVPWSFGGVVIAQAYVGAPYQSNARKAR
jgi:hypothetical protein